MAIRPTISPAETAIAVATVPAPMGYTWEWDPAASGDRLRLFSSNAGDVCVVYADGEWAVTRAPNTRLFGCARGTAPTLEAGMRRALEAARMCGWTL
jgi:hypothetical protein